MVIGTNIAAMQSARYMDDAMNRLSTSLSRLSSGSKITSPEDDAAGLAQALKLGAESNRNKAVVSNLTNALSYSQTQDGLLEKVQKATERMGELAMLANDVTKTDTDRSNYHQEFSQLQSYISDIKDKKFNGISLFGSSSQSVTNEANGGTLSLTGINLSTPADRVKLLKIDTEVNLGVVGDYKVTTLAGSGTAGSTDTDTEGRASYSYTLGSKHTNNQEFTDHMWVLKEDWEKQPFSNGDSVEIGGQAYLVSSMNTGDGNDVLTGKPLVYFNIDTSLNGTFAVGDSISFPVQPSFNNPQGLTVDSSGNVYVVEDHQIRKITPDGVVTTLAGSGSSGSDDGTGTSASFNSPVDLTVDSSGNLYVVEYRNHNIRKITPEGVVTTIAGTGSSGSADGSGTSASFNEPGGITVDSSGNLYVSDSENHTIRKIDTDLNVTTFAGTAGAAGEANGYRTSATFQSPIGVTLDDSGNLYVAESGHHNIRKIDTDGNVTTYAGSGWLSNPVSSQQSNDGTGSEIDEPGFASFFGPVDVTLDSSGNLYVAEAESHKIRKVTPEGVVTTIAGNGSYSNDWASGSTDGTGTSASFNEPRGIETDSSGNLYVADKNNNKIRKLIAEPIDAIKTATQEIANLRAQVGANMARLENEVSGVKMYDENLTNAISRIIDVDVAQESTIYAKNNILQQAATAMLSQANVLPQSTLRLLGV